MKQNRAGLNGQLGYFQVKGHRNFILPLLLGPGSPRGPLDVEVCFSFLGELENAQSTLQRCLELDPTSVDAHLLMSHIYLAQGNFAMCSHCLELGVSHNFQVWVLYAQPPTQHPTAHLAAAPTCPGRVVLGAPCSLQTLLLAKGRGRLSGLLELSPGWVL